jgi:hypothetical protein
MQIIIQNGVVVGAVSFTTGFVARKTTLRKMSEDDILAMAMWLANHGRSDEGEQLIDQWCAGFVFYHH